MSFETKHFCFVNYTLLSEDDLESILQARNHPEIACWMENVEPISWESHIKYVHSLNHRSDRIYYAVYGHGGGGKIIGSQAINPIKGVEGESGLYLFIEYQGRGLGKLMKQEFIEYIFKNNLLHTVTEKVKLNNYRNIDINLSLGFLKTHEDSVYAYFSLSKDRFLNTK